MKDGYEFLAPVNSFMPQNDYGLYHMIGNVWEWVDSGNGDERITRGGSWWYNASRQLADDIATKPMDTRVGYIGFRCVATF
jgi:formylglycine-generating enzyme required for sulfatase activity